MSTQDYPFVTPEDGAPDPNSAAATPAIPANAGPQPGVMQQWNDALGDPTVRSSLLQFGISMLQPPSFGDSFGSQFGRAVGSAGEAASNRDTEEQKRQDTASKTTLREARAGAAESRAREAGATLDIKRGQLELGQQRLGISQYIQGQRRHRDAQAIYNKAVSLLPPDVRFGDGSKIPTFHDWAMKNGFADVANGPPTDIPGVTSGAPAAPATTPGSVDANEARTQAQSAIQARPDRADAIRARYKQLTGQEPDF